MGIDTDALLCWRQRWVCRLNVRPRARVSTKNKNISGEDELPLKGVWALCEMQDKEVFWRGSVWSHYSSALRRARRLTQMPSGRVSDEVFCACVQLERDSRASVSAGIGTPHFCSQTFRIHVYELIQWLLLSECRSSHWHPRVWDNKINEKTP